MSKQLDRLDVALIAAGVVIGFDVGRPIGHYLFRLALAALR